MTEETRLIINELKKIDGKITEVETKLGERITEVETKLEERITEVETKLEGHITEVETRLEGRITEVETRLGDEIQTVQKIQTILENRVKNIETTLENETNRNIRIIAEGHLDLKRKLDETMKVEQEREILLLRVNRLENEVRQLKEHIESIA